MSTLGSLGHFVFAMLYALSIDGQRSFFSYTFVTSTERVAFASVLIACIAAFVFGCIYRHRRTGIIVIVCSVFSWLLCGFISIVMTG
jgi:hypothetical protein